MPRHLVLAVALLAAPAFAQDAPSLVTTAPRVLHSAQTEVKTADGGLATYRYSTVYDPVAGEYIRTVEDVDTGEILQREVLLATLTAPTEEEDAYARDLIASDPEIAGLMAKAEYPVKITGGFVLSREEGHACGPGSRCLQYDVLETLPDLRTARRIRYVVVDLRAGRFVSRNFNADTEGNLANPAMRQDSRRASE